MLKFFRIKAAGGIAMLKALAAPLSNVDFCPTGVILIENAANRLALPNVLTLGSSSVAPIDLRKRRDWKAVGDIAERTVYSLTQRANLT